MEYRFHHRHNAMPRHGFCNTITTLMCFTVAVLRAALILIELELYPLTIIFLAIAITLATRRCDGSSNACSFLCCWLRK